MKFNTRYLLVLVGLLVGMGTGEVWGMQSKMITKSPSMPDLSKPTTGKLDENMPAENKQPLTRRNSISNLNPSQTPLTKEQLKLPTKPAPTASKPIDQGPLSAYQSDPNQKDSRESIFEPRQGSGTSTTKKPLTSRLGAVLSAKLPSNPLKKTTDTKTPSAKTPDAPKTDASQTPKKEGIFARAATSLMSEKDKKALQGDDKDAKRDAEKKKTVIAKGLMSVAGVGLMAVLVMTGLALSGALTPGGAAATDTTGRGDLGPAATLQDIDAGGTPPANAFTLGRSGAAGTINMQSTGSAAQPASPMIPVVQSISDNQSFGRTLTELEQQAVLALFNSIHQLATQLTALLSIPENNRPADFDAQSTDLQTQLIDQGKNLYLFELSIRYSNDDQQPVTGQQWQATLDNNNQLLQSIPQRANLMRFASASDREAYLVQQQAIMNNLTAENMFIAAQIEILDQMSTFQLPVPLPAGTTAEDATTEQQLTIASALIDQLKASAEFQKDSGEGYDSSKMRRLADQAASDQMQMMSQPTQAPVVNRPVSNFF